jgi:hypothetical protein
MRSLKPIAFGFLCTLVFLVAAATTSISRAKYRAIPRLKTEFAYLYAGILERYSFLQYSQAGPDQGKEALLRYLKFLEQIRDEPIQYPPNLLNRDFGLTYLRLYRLESTAGNSVAADEFMRSAQVAWSAVGWKSDEVSVASLQKLIEARESEERKLYNNIGGLRAARAETTPKSQEAPE